MYQLKKNLGISSQLSKTEITLLRQQAGDQPEDLLQFVEEKTDLDEDFLYARHNDVRTFIWILNISNCVF